MIRAPGRLAFVLLSLAAIAGCAAPGDVPAPAKIAPAEPTFRFAGWAGPAMKVWYQAPAEVTRSTPVVFVMHGVGRDADRYFAEWAPIAVRHGFILVVPEFPQADFPGSRSYNEGNLYAEDGTPRPRSQWSFAAIEPLFDAIKARSGSEVPAYALYGHSAGGQFVHRYVLFMPEARLGQAVAANAGWYTMPDLAVRFPYGLAGTVVDEERLRAALGRPLTVLLGTADTDAAHPSLRRTPEANAQGPHRYARGLGFYRRGAAAAERLGTPFGWRLEETAGVEHRNGDMAAAAAALLDD